MTGRAWCPACRRRQPIADEFIDSEPTARAEIEYGVIALECGHDRTTRLRDRPYRASDSLTWGADQ